MNGLYALDGIAPTLPEDRDIWVAPGAIVVGNVTLQTGASVWFNCSLRGDNEPIVVGAGSNIQENCVLHTDPGYPLAIGTNCTIGHKALLHGCTIGDGALVGMNATVMNGAVIGEGALIGAGAMITEGKVIPPGSLVLGSPGKVIRTLDASARMGLIALAEKYQWNMRRHRDGLTPVE